MDDFMFARPALPLYRDRDWGESHLVSVYIDVENRLGEMLTYAGCDHVERSTLPKLTSPARLVHPQRWAVPSSAPLRCVQPPPEGASKWYKESVAPSAAPVAPSGLMWRAWDGAGKASDE